MLALFDLDGTLVNSEKGIVRCIAHTLHTMGITNIDDATIRASIGGSLFDYFIEWGVSPQRLDEAIDVYRAEYFRTGVYEVEVIPGIPEVVESLAASGWTLAVATIKVTEAAEEMLRHVGIAQYFSHVSGTSMDKTRKTKIANIEHAMTSLDIGSDNTVMIGDRGEDIRGAVHWGVRAIGVTWGYGDRSEFEVDNVIGVAGEPKELLEILDKV